MEPISFSRIFYLSKLGSLFSFSPLPANSLVQKFIKIQSHFWEVKFTTIFNNLKIMTEKRWVVTSIKSLQDLTKIDPAWEFGALISYYWSNMPSWTCYWTYFCSSKSSSVKWPREGEVSFNWNILRIRYVWQGFLSILNSV